MGFGIAALGFGFMLTYEAGGGVIAGLLLAYGFYLASRTDKRFLYASFFSLMLIPYSILLFLNVIKVIVLMKTLWLKSAGITMFWLSFMTMCYLVFSAVKDIAEENKSIRLFRGAKRQIGYNVVVFTSYLLFMNIGSFGIKGLEALIYTLMYVTLLTDLWFMHKCFIMITTEKQYEKDKIRYNEEEEKNEKKKQRHNRKN